MKTFKENARLVPVLLKAKYFALITETNAYMHLTTKKTTSVIELMQQQASLELLKDEIDKVIKSIDRLIVSQSTPHKRKPTKKV